MNTVFSYFSNFIKIGIIGDFYIVISSYRHSHMTEHTVWLAGLCKHNFSTFKWFILSL
jgi:hypothetical protein